VIPKRTADFGNSSMFYRRRFNNSPEKNITSGAAIRFIRRSNSSYYGMTFGPCESTNNIARSVADAAN
jgi:hypothetical protein